MSCASFARTSAGRMMKHKNKETIETGGQNRNGHQNGSGRRDHDGFLKYVYSVPENTRTLLHIAAKADRKVADTLSEVDLETLEEIPEPYNNVSERGEADLAFKVKGVCGEDVFFGILLEHKSSPSDDILSQLYRYTYEVMVDKREKEFAWMPTKAIVVYNGNVEWDPLAEFRRKPRAKFQGRLLPFECAFVNLAEIDDRDCTADDNAEAAIGTLTLKYAFNPAKFEEMLPEIERMLRRLDPARASTLVGKIELYLGEYITRTSLEELKMAFKSIGQRLGFVSAGDERRAAVKAAEKALAERLRKKHEAEIAAKDGEIAAKDGEIAAKEAEIRRLSLLLAQKV